MKNFQHYWVTYAKNKAAFLYVCETGDGLQRMRNRLFRFGVVPPNTIFFSNFLAKSFVVSIIFGTFVFELERTGKNGRDDDSNE